MKILGAALVAVFQLRQRMTRLWPVVLAGLVIGVALAGTAGGGLAGARQGTTPNAVVEGYGESIGAAAIQGDGKIVVAGRSSVWASDSSDFDPMQTTFFALARYKPDGRLDPSFGSGGRVLTGFRSSTFDGAGAVAVQKDGKILAAGSSTRGQADNAPADFALVRYRPDGRLDPSFGSGGKVLTGFGSKHNDVASAVAIQPDGKIIAAGTSTRANSGQFALARYAADGRLDPGFGTGGKVLTGFGPDRDGRASAVAIQADGKIVAAGTSAPPPPSEGSPDDDFALARYNPDGRLDPSFGSGGTVLTDLTGVDDLHAVAIQPDGKIVAVGTSEPTWATPGGSLTSALARYTTDGRLDPGFGTDGRLLTDVQDRMNAVAIQGDGKIVAAGHGDGGNFTLTRLTPGGRLDATFGTGGTAQADFGNSDDDAFAVAIQGDGTIVAAGRSQSVDTVVDHFALARYTTDGALDPSFAGGTVITRFARAYTRVASLSAAKTMHSVLIRWRTMSERGSRGFNVYRARYVNFDVGYTRLAKANVKMLRSKGSPTRGASYSFLHRRAPAHNDYYWIKEVKRDGKQVLYGPTQVKR